MLANVLLEKVKTTQCVLKFYSSHMQVALSDTGIPKVIISASAASEDEQEVDVSDEEFLQFDTSSVPVIITLTKVIFFACIFSLCWRNMLYRFHVINTV